MKKFIEDQTQSVVSSFPMVFFHIRQFKFSEVILGATNIPKILHEFSAVNYGAVPISTFFQCRL